jgi:hypothetical protein
MDIKHIDLNECLVKEGREYVPLMLIDYWTDIDLNKKLVLLDIPPTPYIWPTYFHNITDCSDQKWNGPSSLHR